MQSKMFAKGIAVGRPFPALDKMMRVTIGTDEEMVKFRQALVEVLDAAKDSYIRS
jgi:histidinol-phosphate/aromatic aminotransferase/cobyric acid decarboxylase-like protein